MKKNINSQENVSNENNVDVKTINIDKTQVNLTPKSKTSTVRLSNTLNYEDLISQTKEIDVNVIKSEIQLVEEDSRLRRERIELLESNYADLNAKPLVGVDSYESYALVLNKSSWNYQEIKQRNTFFTILDMSIQTHLYMYEGKVIDVAYIQKILKTFVLNVFAKITKGVPVVINPVIIFDAIRFDKSKIIPVTVANPKLMPPLGVVEWDSLVEEGEVANIVSVFIKLLENALTNGHEIEFFEDTLLVRNQDGITSLYISEKSAQVFNNAVIDNIIPEKPKVEELKDPFAKK